jgi:hypothetical protein
MSAPSRSTLVRGAGTVQLGAGPVIYDKDGIEAALETTRFAIGNVDQRRDDAVVKVRFTPSGAITAAMMASLYPYSSPNIGASIFTASDVSAIIHSRAGKKLTLTAAALTRMPDLYLSAAKTAFGQGELTAVYGNGKLPSDANSLYTLASEAFSDASFARDEHLTILYAAAWGEILADIVTESGWTISFETGVSMYKVDDVGTIDGVLDDVGVMAKCTPVNLSEAIWDELRAQDEGAIRGMTERQTQDLVITGADDALVFTLNDAALVAGPLRWGRNVVRSGEIAFIGHRLEDTGVYSTLFSFTFP